MVLIFRSLDRYDEYQIFLDVSCWCRNRNVRDSNLLLFVKSAKAR